MEMATPKSRDFHRDTTEEEEVDEGQNEATPSTVAPEMAPTHHGKGGRPRGNPNIANFNNMNNLSAGTSVYSNNKIKHLKKEDGIPLWRKDIQYDFLRAVFEDTTPAFTNMDGSSGHSFAEIYINAMAHSSKTSKILSEKLLRDKPAALNMAMVCLLVNVGRMNTTLNFFPEMRAQLRTYHSIPSLQAHQDPNAYKQLQDAPRLKSILKGASEDTEQPGTLEKIKASPIPRTNPVHLIFVMSQYAPKVSELHFNPPREFFDLIIRSTISSRSRAKAFLWLMWWYLESDFTKNAAENNPYGPGEIGEGPSSLPIKVPTFEALTDEQAALENVDTQEEILYGEEKQKERKRILEHDINAGPPKRSRKSDWVNNTIAASEDGVSPAPDTASPAPRGRRPRYVALDNGYGSDSEQTHSASPSSAVGFHNFETRPTPTSGSRIGSLLNNDAPPPKTGRGRYPRAHRLVLKTKMGQPHGSPSPGPHGHPGLHYPTETGPHHKRSRPLTQHQLAVERNRQEKVDWRLYKKQQRVFARSRRSREKQGALWRAWRRVGRLENQDTEHEIAVGGLVPDQWEDDDYGEEAKTYVSALKRAVRRLKRWDSGAAVVKSKAAKPVKFMRESVENDEDDEENEDELDDMDRELLGEGEVDDGGQFDEQFDEMEVD